VRPLPLPSVTPADLLTACIAGVADLTTATRLITATPTMLTAAATYHTNAAARALYVVPPVSAGGCAYDEDMKNLYKGQMSSAKGAARNYYDLIMSAAINRKCPLCGVGTVRTLDHHLPKSKYPAFSVCPYNLVPACDYCQAGKLAKHPADAGEQTIHPYYDDYTAEQWIYGVLSRVGNPVVQFHVSPPSSWPVVDRQRVQRHFDVVKLGIVYTSSANDDLATMRDQLVRLGVAGGSKAVHAHLDGERERWMSRLNSWQHVMYLTLASNAWFVQGGYASIPV
jgi:hypothetical protein